MRFRCKGRKISTGLETTVKTNLFLIVLFFFFLFKIFISALQWTMFKNGVILNYNKITLTTASSLC